MVYYSLFLNILFILFHRLDLFHDGIISFKVNRDNRSIVSVSTLQELSS